MASFTKAGYQLRNVTFPGSGGPVSFGPNQPYAIGKANVVVYDPRSGTLVPAPAAGMEVPGTEICVVSSFALVVEATGRVEDFSSRMHYLLYRGANGLPARLAFGEGTQVLAVADPPAHRAPKSRIPRSHGGDAKAVRLEAEVTEVAGRCIDLALSRDQSVDFMDTIVVQVPITLITELIGFRDGDLASLLRAAFDSTALVGARLTLDELNALMAKSAETYGWITEQLATYTAHSDGEILATSARGIEVGALSEEDGVIISG